MSDWILKIDAARLLPKRTFVIETDEELAHHLDDMAAHKEGSGMLIHQNKKYLQFGIQTDLGFCSFDPRSTKQDYLWAFTDGQDSDEVIVFNVGNTETEIPKFRCLPWSLVKSIVVRFYRTGTLLESVWWDPDKG